MRRLTPHLCNLLSANRFFDTLAPPENPGAQPYVRGGTAALLRPGSRSLPGLFAWDAARSVPLQIAHVRHAYADGGVAAADAVGDLPPGQAVEIAQRQDLPYLAVLVAAAVCALYICVNYIHIQSGMTGRMDTIKTLEQQLDTLKAENDALETSINTSVDLDHVYKVATEELGMVYAGKDQVLLYNQTESEYVKQYEDIPEQ